MGNLKEKILSDLVSDYSSLLDKKFEEVKPLLKITNKGSVEILQSQDLTGEEKILVYLLGKLYAKEAELSSSNGVTNKELVEELGKSEGSVLPWLKSLRDKKIIKQNKELNPIEHYLPINKVDFVIQMVKAKIKK